MAKALPKHLGFPTAAPDFTRPKDSPIGKGQLTKAGGSPPDRGQTESPAKPIGTPAGHRMRQGGRRGTGKPNE